jgi:hypothetical protein
MRIFLVLLFSVLLQTTSAQDDSLALRDAIAKLDQALLKQDSAALDQLLDGKLSFGHSNGWVQTKQDVWNDFKEGRLNYLDLTTTEVKILQIGKELATITMKVQAKGKLKEKEFDLKLTVLQVWKKDKKGWQLFARQSAKID